MNAQIMDYDPNLTNSGKRAKQTVRLTFGQWDYRATREVVVGGNCTGRSVIDSAVWRAYEELEGDRSPRIELTRANGDTLLCTDDEDRGEDWLSDMLVAAEIIAIVPDTKP